MNVVLFIWDAKCNGINSLDCKGGSLSRNFFIKVGRSDPVLLYGKDIAHRIKGTLGITG